MAEEKPNTETKSNELEREYIIPLRKKVKIVPRYKKTNKAVKTIKEFLVRHMKVRDGDLNKIKIDKYLNEEMWHRGIKKPPAKIKVKAKKEGENVLVSLVDFPERLKFKKAREEKEIQKAEEVVKAQKQHMAAAQAQAMEEQAKKTPESEPKSEEKSKDKKEEEKEIREDTEKEKEASVAEEEQKTEKKLSKENKNTARQKTGKQQKNDRKKYNKSSRGQ